jgi:hypothetical protein
MKGKVLLLFCLLIGMGFVWSACIVAVVDYSGTDSVPNVGEFSKIDDFLPGGTLSLRNFDGDIEIVGWDNDEVEVYAEKKIPRPMQPRFRVMSWGRVIPKIDYDKSDDRIMIRTRAPDREGRDSVVDYYLNVPHSINLTDITARTGNVTVADVYGQVNIKLQNGDIQVENFSGSMVSSVVEGSIIAALYDLRSEDEIRIMTREGDITVSLQSGVNARIEGSFPNGQVFSEFEAEIPEGANRFTLILGEEEGASVYIETLKGNLHLKKVR